MAPARLLLVEDTVSLATLYREYLRDEGHAITHAPTLAAARAVLARDPPDAVLLDLRLPDGDGLGLLAEISASAAAPPVVVLTAHGSVATAVAAMRAGAADFLVKPFPAERLVVTPPPRARPSSSPARAAPARSWRPRRCTRSRRAPPGPSCR